MAAARPLDIGLVGPGRTRGGLGPFLARFLEQAGCRVTAVAGRTPARTRQNAEDLARTLGHPVRACRDLDELRGSGIAALVIASPPEHHLAALQAALRAGLPVLCEKPLVTGPQSRDGMAAVEAFAAGGLVLVENCQWPLVLPALRELHPDLPPGPARTVALGLGPGHRGRAMVEDSLSHLLSICQSAADLGPGTGLAGLWLEDPSLRAPANVLRLQLRGPQSDLSAELHLRHCPEQPRPAWVALDGRRMDRRIGAGYSIRFAGNGREVAVADPTALLVAAFVDLLRTQDLGAVRRHHEQIGLRLRLYRDVMARIGQP